MIIKIIESAACIIECIMMSIFLTNYFAFRFESKKQIKFWGLCSALTFFDIIGTFVLKHEYVFLIGMISTEFIFAVFALKGNILEKLLISIIGYLLFYFVNLPVLYILGFISGTSSSEVANTQDGRRIICLFITKLIYFIIIKMILRLRKKERYEFENNEWFIIISLFIITLLIGFAMDTVITYRNFSNYIMTAVVILLSALDVIVFQFMRRLSIANQKKAEHKMLEMQIHQQEIEARQLEQQYNKISIFQHDFQNQIECICALIRDKDYQKAIQYAESLSQNSCSLIYPHIHCSSSVINAVVNEKISIAQEYDIKCTCQIVVSVPQYLEYDMSILLANLLDNAIDACRNNQEQSRIVLTISEVAAYYRINVKNTITNSVLQKNKELKTHKYDKEHHGWGLKSVHKIARIHNGDVDIYEKNDMFIVNVLLMKED